MPEYPRSPFDKNGKSITPKVADDVLDATIIGSTTPAAGAFTSLKASINVETLAAAKTLVVTDYMVQWLNPNGVERIVTLPAEASSTNLIFIILNTGTVATFNLVVKNAAVATIGTLGPGMTGIFSCNGTTWKWENDSGVYSDAVSGNIEIEGLLSQIGLGGSTYFGSGAGKADDLDGNNNTGIGKNAIYSNTIGYQNTVVGMNAFHNNTTGYHNTVVGMNAVYINTTGYQNTALGLESLYHNSTGSRNIALGSFAGKHELGSDAFYVNNQDRINTANDKIKSLIYGQMAAAVADQKLTFNATVELTQSVILGRGSTLEKAMSGDILLGCVPATAGTSAAVLNAAAAGTHTQVVTINLKDAAAALHKWASLAVNATTSEVVVDADVAAPAVSDATPNLAAGTIDVTLTYDTDANVTKTYAINDTVTLTISQPTGGILGYPIANATFVDTIIA